MVAFSWWSLVSSDLWRPIGLLSSLVSALGIILSFRNWPMANTVAALGMNVVTVLLAVALPA